MKISSKKGLTQIDWVISLAIFIIFLFAYFMFVIPKIQTTTSPEGALEQISKAFIQEAKYDVNETTIFIKAETMTADEPILVKTNNNLQFSDERYVSRAGSNMAFLANLNIGMNTLKAYSSEAAYNQKNVNYDFNANETNYDNGDIELTFYRGLLKVLKDGATTYIQTISYEGLNTPDSYEYNATDLTSYHAAEEQSETCTTFGVSNRVYCTSKQNTITITLDNSLSDWEIITKNYTFSGNNTQDKIASDVKSIKLSGTRTVHIYLLPETNASLEYGPSNLTVTLTKPQDYIITLDETINPYILEKGIETTKTGISLSKLNTMQTQDLKQKWSIPNEFSIQIQKTQQDGNITRVIDIFNYKTSNEPADKNIYTDSHTDYVLSKYGEEEKVKTIIRTW